ncbi:MAG: DNA polymerase IV [Deltaproteobacteria bacterium]|nr:DNA polymerase IV [Deltaproteobacteria bacterium]
MYRHIIHIHIPAFPIAVARVFQPGLRDRPVVMAPPHSERAFILSVSLEARREGIFKGMPLKKAIKLCPDLIVLPPNQNLTGKVSKSLAKVVAHYTPLWEPSRPGHIYMDITGTDRLWGSAKDTAIRLRREIKEHVHLLGMVGIAGNKMVSSIASRIGSSKGVLDVDHGKESAFIAPLRASLLPGVGHARKKILLEELNITTIREIAALDMDSLKLIFGRQAYVIHQRALGIDPTPVYPPHMEPTITEEAILSQDEIDDEKLLRILYRLVEKCSHQLLNRSLCPRKAGLIFSYTDHKEIIRQINLPHVSFWNFDLYAPLERIFLKAYRRRIRVRFMKVWFQDFSPLQSQLSLFSTSSPVTDKKAIAFQTLNHIRERYGYEAIKYGRAA